MFSIPQVAKISNLGVMVNSSFTQSPHPLSNQVLHSLPP